MIITKCMYPMEKKNWNQVQNGALITRCRHLTTGSAVIARSNAKYQGARDQRIKPKFPRNFSFPCYKEGDGSWHVERNYDVKEDARVLDGKNSSGPERNKRGDGSGSWTLSRRKRLLELSLDESEPVS